MATMIRFADKRISFVALSIFVLAFPILEGFSNTVYPVGSLLLGILVAVIWLLESLITMRIRFSLEARVLFLFTCWMVFTLSWSADAYSSLNSVIRLVSCLILYVLVTDLVDTERRFIVTIYCYLLGVFVISVSAFENISSQSTYNDLSNRYSASGFDPNSFGFISASALPLILIAIHRRKLVTRMVGLVLGVGLIYLIISSASRAAAGATALVVVGMILIFFSARRIFWFLIWTLIAAAIFYFLFIDIIPDLAIDRLINMKADDGGGRLLIWRDAFRMIPDHLLLGHGYGMSLLFLGEQAHNTFVSAFFEGGIVAFLLWSYFWGIHLYRATKNGTIGSKNVFSMALLLSLFSILGAAFTLNWEYRKTMYLIMGLSVAYQEIRKKYLVN